MKLAPETARRGARSSRSTGRACALAALAPARSAGGRAARLRVGPMPGRAARGLGGALLKDGATRASDDHWRYRRALPTGFLAPWRAGQCARPGGRGGRAARPARRARCPWSRGRRPRRRADQSWPRPARSTACCVTGACYRPGSGAPWRTGGTQGGRQVPAGTRCRGGPCLGATPDQARRLAAESAPPFRAGEAEPTRHAERLERRTNPRRVRRCTWARRVGDRMNPQQKESKRTRSPRRSWSLVERGRERTRAARAWPRSPPRFASQATAWPPADSRQHTSRSGSGSWQLIAA